jgi:hypothetical protein
MFNKTIKGAHPIDAAIPDSHSLNCNITGKLQKDTDLKEELTIIWQLNTPCIMPTVLSTAGIIRN